MSTTPRIPLALQKVFLASNSGAVVDEAPAGNVASKIFPSKWSGKFIWSKSKSTPKHAKYRRKGSKHAASDQSEHTEHTEATSAHSLTNLSDIVQIDATVKKQISHNAEVLQQERQIPDLSPQRYLHRLLTSRGYSTAFRITLDSGYYSRPTDLQRASYHSYLIRLAVDGKKRDLREILECGISPNPCSIHGESLVHTVCRKCDPQTLQILIDAGASLQVSDDYGRTPLHNACWRTEPSFEIIEMVASKDLYLFQMADSRGSLPLSYVPLQHWKRWNNFLESKKEVWWPKAKSSMSTLLANLSPNTRPIQDPKNALQPEIASMLAAGRITPKAAIRLQMDSDKMRQQEERLYGICEDDSFPGCFSDEDSNEDSSSDGEDYGDLCHNEPVTTRSNEEHIDLSDDDNDLTTSMKEDDMEDFLGLPASGRAKKTTNTMATF